MVTMNIVRAGFKPAPTKNKKDIGKIKNILDNLNTNQRREVKG